MDKKYHACFVVNVNYNIVAKAFNFEIDINISR